MTGQCSSDEIGMGPHKESWVTSRVSFSLALTVKVNSMLPLLKSLGKVA